MFKTRLVAPDNFPMSRPHRQKGSTWTSSVTIWRIHQYLHLHQHRHRHPHRTRAIPISRQRKGAMHLVFSPPALEIQHLVGVRSFWIPPAASTPVLAVERWPSTTQIPIPQWARQRSCSTPPAHKTPPLEPTRWSLTTAVTPTLPLVTFRS